MIFILFFNKFNQSDASPCIPLENPPLSTPDAANIENNFDNKSDPVPLIPESHVWQSASQILANSHDGDNIIFYNSADGIGNVQLSVWMTAYEAELCRKKEAAESESISQHHHDNNSNEAAHDISNETLLKLSDAKNSNLSRRYVPEYGGSGNFRCLLANKDGTFFAGGKVCTK